MFAQSPPESAIEPTPADVNAEATALRAAAPSSVDVGTLGTVEGPATGLLDASDGGLGGDIWSGSSRDTIEGLLSRVPLATADPAMRDLAKRVVLTRAAAPMGPAKRAIITVRIEELLGAGLVEEAGALAAQAVLSNDEDFARLQADALLISNRKGDVCGDLTTTRLTSDEPFWLQLRFYCATQGGDSALADLTDEVIKAKAQTDPVFQAAMDHPNAFTVFSLLQEGQPIPGDIAGAMGTSVNLLAMRDTRNSPRVRLDAAERIITTGAASIAELRAIADARDLPLSEFANAQNDAQNLPFFAGQVLLRRAAQLKPSHEKKAFLIASALNLGERAGLLPLAAGLQGDVLASIKPANTASAPLFVRALMLAGYPDAAARWPSTDVLANFFVPKTPAKLHDTLGAYADALLKTPPDPDPQRDRKALLLGLGSALGQLLPPDIEIKAQTLAAREWNGKRPEADVLRRIETAAAEPGRKGEAILAILDAIHTIGFRDMAPDVTIKLVKTLNAMGLPDAARDLALEAMLLYVPPPPLPVPVQ